MLGNLDSANDVMVLQRLTNQQFCLSSYTTSTARALILHFSRFLHQPPFPFLFPSVYFSFRFFSHCAIFHPSIFSFIPFPLSPPSPSHSIIHPVFFLPSSIFRPCTNRFLCIHLYLSSLRKSKPLVFFCTSEMADSAFYFQTSQRLFAQMFALG